jgi:hypothetical protein
MDRRSGARRCAASVQSSNYALISGNGESATLDYFLNYDTAAIDTDRGCFDPGYQA